MSGYFSPEIVRPQVGRSPFSSPSYHSPFSPIQTPFSPIQAPFSSPVQSSPFIPEWMKTPHPQTHRVKISPGVEEGLNPSVSFTLYKDRLTEKEIKEIGLFHLYENKDDSNLKETINAALQQHIPALLFEALVRGASAPFLDFPTWSEQIQLELLREALKQHPINQEILTILRSHGKIPITNIRIIDDIPTRLSLTPQVEEQINVMFESAIESSNVNAFDDLTRHYIPTKNFDQTAFHYDFVPWFSFEIRRRYSDLPTPFFREEYEHYLTDLYVNAIYYGAEKVYEYLGSLRSWDPYWSLKRLMEYNRYEWAEKYLSTVTLRPKPFNGLLCYWVKHRRVSDSFFSLLMSYPPLYSPSFFAKIDAAGLFRLAREENLPQKIKVMQHNEKFVQLAREQGELIPNLFL